MPNGVDLDYFQLATDEDVEEPLSLVFVGGLSCIRIPRPCDFFYARYGHYCVDRFRARACESLAGHLLKTWS